MGPVRTSRFTPRFIAPRGIAAFVIAPRGIADLRTQDFSVLADPSGLSLQVRSLSCAMSGERVGGSSRETRGAMEARGDGASDDVLGF